MKKVYLNFTYDYSSVAKFSIDSSAETLSLKLTKSFSASELANISNKVINGYEPYARFICIDYTSGEIKFVTETKCNIYSSSNRISADYTSSDKDESTLIGIFCFYSCILPKSEDLPILASFRMNLSAISNTRVILMKLQTYVSSTSESGNA